MTPAALLQRAAASVGHDDFGDDAFLPPLTLLLESSQATGRLSPTGAKVLRSVLLRHLRNRLHVAAYLRARPHATQRALTAPVVVTGLPRTGTSLLHNLLAQDPRHRFLRLWEALHPVPPGAGGAVADTTLAGTTLDETALLEQAERWLERFYALAPGFRTIHPLTPAGPEECDALLQNAFASLHFDDMFDAEAYSQWFWHGTLDREYAYYALQLRVLTREEDTQAQRRWLLKSPGHLPHLGALLRALPGAVVMHCHRDPVQAVASYASLIATVRAPNTDGIGYARVGAQALARCRTAMERALAVRAAAGEDRFVDVAYGALVADPIGTVAAIYDRLGAPLPTQVQARMQAWLADNPQHRHGVHRYDARRFGLSAAAVRRAFAGYLERFSGSLTGESPQR